MRRAPQVSPHAGSNELRPVQAACEIRPALASDVANPTLSPGKPDWEFPSRLPARSFRQAIRTWNQEVESCRLPIRNRNRLRTQWFLSLFRKRKNRRRTSRNHPGTVPPRPSCRRKTCPVRIDWMSTGNESTKKSRPIGLASQNRMLDYRKAVNLSAWRSRTLARKPVRLPVRKSRRLRPARSRPHNPLKNRLHDLVNNRSDSLALLLPATHHQAGQRLRMFPKYSSPMFPRGSKPVRLVGLSEDVRLNAANASGPHRRFQITEKNCSAIRPTCIAHVHVTTKPALVLIAGIGSFLTWSGTFPRCRADSSVYVHEVSRVFPTFVSLRRPCSAV